MPALLKFVAVALGQWVVGVLASEVLKQVQDPTLRDWALVLIWPVLLVVGTVIFLGWIWRTAPPKEPSPTTEATISDPRDSRLAELERKNAMEQRDMTASALHDMANEGRSMRMDYEQASATFHGQQGSSDAWARAYSWQRKVASVLSRIAAHPEYESQFTANIDPVAATDPDWRVGLARFLGIRAQLLDDIAEDYRMSAV